VRARWCLALLLAGCLRLANYRPHCTQDTDCPGDDVCDGQFCIDRCVELPDSCSTGQNCQDGHCVNDGACASDSVCDAGNICTGGKCVPGCRHSADCDFAHNMGCIDSICQPATLCITTYDGPAPQTCHEGACVYTACGGSKGPCLANLKCEGGHCVLPETMADAGASPEPSGDCGKPDHPCCAGFRCEAGCCARVADSTFACVFLGTSCGSAAPGVCIGGACGACGAVGQPCCSDSSGRWCTAANAACDGGTSVCQACGGENQACCGTSSLAGAPANTLRGCTAAGVTCRSIGANQFLCRR
jgi:hypothetical protein